MAGCAFLLLLSFGASAQSYHYDYTLLNVTDRAAAKNITDPMRSLFNSEAEPYKYYPAFLDEKDCFSFNADLPVTQEQLAAVLAPYGITILAFNRTAIASTEPIKQ